MTERELFKLLESRYSASDWVLVPQVPNGTGRYKDRTADAVAMSLWPSRGLEVHGFEMKVSRADWLKELNGHGGKAEAVAQYCDRWWIVADKDVVKPDELPKAWGMLVVRGSQLAVKVQAPIKEGTKAIDRAFLSGMMRACEKHWMRKATDEQLQAQLRAEFERGRETERTIRQAESSGKAKKYDRLKAVIDDFEKATGLRISEYSDGKEIASKIRAAEMLDPKHWRSAASVIKEAASDIAKAQTKMEEIFESLQQETSAT